jgi:hypothetical protein
MNLKNWPDGNKASATCRLAVTLGESSSDLCMGKFLNEGCMTCSEQVQPVGRKVPSVRVSSDLGPRPGREKLKFMQFSL